MARTKKVEYVVGIARSDGSYQYVTEINNMDRTAKWEADKEAMTFDKDWAVELCRGLAWNGFVGQPMIKLDWREYINPPKEEYWVVLLNDDKYVELYGTEEYVAEWMEKRYPGRSYRKLPWRG